MIRLLLSLRKPLEHRLAPLAIALLGSMLALPSVFGGFAADDHFLRMVSSGFEGMEDLKGKHDLDTFVFADGTLERNDKFRDRGLIPWWSAPDVRLAFWRPLASATHYLDFKIFGDRAWIMHLENLIWYALLTLVMCALYRRFIGVHWIAIFGALLYAIDDAHAMPIGWISNRNALMCMVFGVTTLIMHDRWRRAGQWWALPIGLTTFLLGILCGEATIAITGYLFAHAVFMDRGGRLRGLLSLLPYGLVIIPWRMVYQDMGYGATGSGMYLDPVRETGLFVAALIQRLPLLLNAQMFYPPSALTVWAGPTLLTIHVVFAIQMLLFMLWVFFPMLKRSPVARMWMLGMIIAVLPVCATFPMDRLLFFAGIGGMGLIAQFLGGMAEATEDQMRAPWFDGHWGRRMRAIGLAYALIIIHIIVSPFSVPVRTLTMTFTGHSLNEAIATLPADESVREKTLILVNAPSDFDTWHVPIMRCSLREPIPLHTWALTVGPFSSEIHRVDENTLEVWPDKSFVPKPWGSMFRGSEPPFQVGEHIDLATMNVEILRVTPDEAKPMIARFTFDKALEDESKLWYIYDKNRYIPWELPAVGETVRLPGSYMFGFGNRAAHNVVPQPDTLSKQITQ